MCFTKPELPWDDLPDLFPAFPAPGRWLPLLKAHAKFVQLYAGRIRVTAVSPENAVRRNYAESLELLRIATIEGVPGMTVDVGSGGGFPGIVIAAVFPEMRVHLVEPLKKRARLLSEMALELALGNVTVHAERAEDAARGALRDRADLVTARAVAELRELLEYTAPLATAGGSLALAKGSSVASELTTAVRAIVELRCAFVTVLPMRSEVSETIQVALFEKVGPTPARYPRRAGTPARTPL